MSACAAWSETGGDSNAPMLWKQKAARFHLSYVVLTWRRRPRTRRSRPPRIAGAMRVPLATVVSSCEVTGTMIAALRSAHWRQKRAWQSQANKQDISQLQVGHARSTGSPTWIEARRIFLWNTLIGELRVEFRWFRCRNWRLRRQAPQLGSPVP